MTPQTGPLPNLWPRELQRAKGLWESETKASFLLLEKVWQLDSKSAETPDKWFGHTIKFIRSRFKFLNRIKRHLDE